MPALAKISVVIPCYNAAPYIAATLRSVWAQADVELQVIVVDDGSTDGSPELVVRDFPQVQLLRQPNRGVGAARNLGIAEAVHPWVAFVDADDIWLPGKLQAQCALLQAHPEARMAYAAWAVWPSVDAEPPAALLAELQAASADTALWAGASGWIYPELLLDCCVWTSTVLVERRLLEELGGFDVNLRIGEDYDLWLRASRLTPILRLAQPLALYRHHPQGVTKRAPRANHKGQVVGQALSRWGLASPDGRLAPRRAVMRNLARSWGDFAGAQLTAGQLPEARASALKALRLNPAEWLGWVVLAKTALRAFRSSSPRVV